MKRALLLAIALFATACVGAPASIESPVAPVRRDASPAALVRAMLGRYQSATSYEDRGTSITVLHADDAAKAERITITFRTAFDRASGRFFFDYTKAHADFGRPTRGVLWGDSSDEIRSWLTFRPRVESLDLERAIAGFKGVSSNTAWNVPAMLLGIGGIWEHTSAAAGEGLPLTLEREETVRGTQCVKVAYHDPGRELSVWIGTEDHAVRRTFERSRVVPRKRNDEEILAALPADLPDEAKIAVVVAQHRARPFVAEQTVDYEPTFDRKIDASRFVFVPPPRDVVSRRFDQRER